MNIFKTITFFKDHGIIMKVKETQHYYKYKELEIKPDKLIIARILHAELEWRNNLRLPWSEETHKIMTQVCIL